ncbi:30S ribosomal protein S20 [Candidatus Roizmanbacteria bacterium]|nr:30S ribosomal protein S20 [Candidatus Roizmanbacteria bacterium]
MPIIRSAKKKLRQDIKREKRNLHYIVSYRKAVQAVKKNKDKAKTKVLVKKAYSAIDKAIKKRVMHKNKGARLKSMVAKSLSP